LSAAARPAKACRPVSPDEAQDVFHDLAEERALLIAVSGGPDSMALLGLLAQWALGPGRPALSAATVDHGLRPHSAAEAAMVAQICARLGVAHRVLLWEGPKPATGLQDAARTERYRLLAQEAARSGCRVVVTAHTQDDQAETLLMRMAHGSGPGGLAGMKRRSRRGGLELVRPLLCFPKTRLVATAQALELPFVTDPSNDDIRFERVRWRRLMPAFAAAGLSAERLAVLARRLARVDAAIVPQVEALRGRLGASAATGFDAGLLFGEPDEVSLRVLALLVLETTGDAAPIRLERLELCHKTLREAFQGRRALRRTLGGSVLSLDPAGMLKIHGEGPRRRGVHPATS
jgi:tRNA(Ile)-lysidine synthase